MKKLVVIVSFLVASVGVQAQSASIVAGPSSSISSSSSSAVVAADLSKDETEAVNKLVGLTPAQYKSVYDIYVAKNARIEAAKVKYAADAQIMASEISIAENSADQFVSQQLTDAQRPKWMDVIRAKYTSKSK